MTRLPDNLVAIAECGTEDFAHELGLVVLSQGCEYWIAADEAGRFELLVPAGGEDHLTRQIELYIEESRHWPPLNPEIPEPHPGYYAAMTWLAALVLSWLVQVRWPAVEEIGMASSEAIQGGEWYRAFTALFLHGDIGHLAGNLLFGAVFLHLVARHVGTVRAWLAVLFAGIVGNLLNAFIQLGETHYSIGASTAVFGAIGVLVMLPVGFAARHAPRRLRRIWVLPLLVGFAFLAWFGTGSARTDTSAHLMGFLSGLPVGLAMGLLVRTEPYNGRS